MKVHLIFDFQHLYYRAKYSNSNRYRKPLTSEVNGETVDTTEIYLVLKEMEKYRKKYLYDRDNNLNSLTISVAADSRSERKEANTSYKASRKSSLTDQDYNNINRLLNMLNEMKYNVYKVDGKEADDIIRNLVIDYESCFDYTVIVTNDSDVLVNVSDRVLVDRYKSSLKTGIIVTRENFECYLSNEFKCKFPYKFPYNCILLYKSTVGDRSDGIEGISGFGVARFKGLIFKLDSVNFDYSKLRDAVETEKLLYNFKDVGILSEVQLKQALDSLKLAKYIKIDNLSKPEKLDTDASRNKVFMKYSMKSLIC